MENKQLIKKYALSLYQIGKKENALDRIHDGAKAISFLFKTSSTFRYFLLTKKIADTDKKQILLDVLKDSCSNYIIALISIIIDEGNIQSLGQILDRFFITMNNESDIIPVRIISSRIINDNELQSLVQNIESKLNKKVNAKNEVDPSLIGGIKLMIGNKVIDGSISHQLTKIKYTLEQV